MKYLHNRQSNSFSATNTETFRPSLFLTKLSKVGLLHCVIGIAGTGLCVADDISLQNRQPKPTAHARKITVEGVIQSRLEERDGMVISWPTEVKPEPWSPKNVVLFGDSLSDSHGDSEWDSNSARSTYNLLRSLKDEKVEKSPGKWERPLDLSFFIERGLSISNIKANLDLHIQEIYRKHPEKGFIGRMLDHLKIEILEGITSALISFAHFFDFFEDLGDLLFEQAAKNMNYTVERLLNRTSSDSRSHRFLTFLKRQSEFMLELSRAELDEILPEAIESQIINITSHLGDLIPVIPDPDYYVTGKWTQGSTGMNKVWIEVLVNMLTPKGQPPARLENRAMAGSWTLCAANKLDRFRSLMGTAGGVKEAAMMIFQGSLVPPCQGLIVESYLNRKREQFKAQHNNKKPRARERLIDDDTLVIFLNSGNDFLNDWANPDEVAQEYVNDVWKIVRAGAGRVAVVLLPDISIAPRYQHAEPEVTDTLSGQKHDHQLNSAAKKQPV